MPEKREYQVFTFEELDEKGQEAALQHFREDSFFGEIAWEDTREDALNIGLKLEGMRWGSMEGKFIEDACHCADLIMKEHGDTTDTYCTAAAFMKIRDEAVRDAPRDELGELEDEHALDNLLDEIESEFLRAILEDYRVMSDRNQEYAYSDERLKEHIEANEYRFLEDGRLD